MKANLAYLVIFGVSLLALIPVGCLRNRIISTILSGVGVAVIPMSFEATIGLLFYLQRHTSFSVFSSLELAIFVIAAGPLFLLSIKNLLGSLPNIGEMVCNDTLFGRKDIAPATFMLAFALLLFAYDFRYRNLHFDLETVLLKAIIVALAEEIPFRFVVPRILATSNTRWPGYIAYSLIFAAIHFDGLGAFVFRFSFSMICYALGSITKKTAYPIIFHSVWNIHVFSFSL